MKKGHAAAFAMIIFTVMVWGFSFISIKVSLQQIPPMSLGLYRFIVAVAILFVAKRIISPGEKITRSDLPLLFGAGMTGVTFYFYSENNGLSLTTASEASIIIGAIPVITMLADRIIFKNRLTPLQYFGVVLSFAGIALIVSKSFSATGNIYGYFYMLGAAFCWVAYNFLTRPLFKKHSMIFIVFWQSFFGLMGFIPFSIAERPHLFSVSPEVWMHVLFLAVLCSAAGYLLYVISMKYLGVVLCSVFINLIPVIAVISAYFVLGERMDVVQMAGGLVVIIGVYLASLAGEIRKNGNGR